MSNVSVKVSIPVTVGGYRGQREEWVEHAVDYEVTVEADEVKLKQPQHQGLIKFSKDDLEAALRMLGESNSAKLPIGGNLRRDRKNEPMA